MASQIDSEHHTATECGGSPPHSCVCPHCTAKSGLTWDLAAHDPQPGTVIVSVIGRCAACGWAVLVGKGRIPLLGPIRRKPPKRKAEKWTPVS